MTCVKYRGRCDPYIVDEAGTTYSDIEAGADAVLAREEGALSEDRRGRCNPYLSDGGRHDLLPCQSRCEIAVDWRKVRSSVTS